MGAVELGAAGRGRLAAYLGQYDPLIGDARTRRTFGGVVEGVVGAGSLCCARIAAASPTLAVAGAAGERRVRRMLDGETTKRSVLSEEALVGSLQGRAVRQLAGAAEVWVAVDMSDLRKPYARAMEALMEVRPLGGKGTVPGYRTITALGVGAGGRRGVLYHHLFSSRAAGFVSEPAETQAALASVQAALAGHAAAATYLLDRGFDDDAVWGRIWAGGQHLVGRVFHFERLVEAPGADGAWGKTNLAAVTGRVRPVAGLAAEMLVRKRGQRREKRQAVAVDLAACPVRVPYRPPGAPRYRSAMRHRDAWLVRVALQDVEADPWWLLTDWPVEDAAGALRVFRMYRMRWAAEDAFKFAKDVLGWEDVQLMDLGAVRTLSALGWVAAAFLYELGVGLDEPAVRLLVRLAGGELRPNRPPGKAVLTRGLRRLLDHAVTDAFLRRERARGPLPPQIAAFLADHAHPP